MVHDHDQIGQRDCFLLRVGDVDEGDAEIALHAPELAAHLQPQEFVEGRQGFVQQQNARIRDQGAGERDALFLAAGKLCRHPVGKARHLYLG